MIPWFQIRFTAGATEEGGAVMQPRGWSLWPCRDARGPCVCSGAKAVDTQIRDLLWRQRTGLLLPLGFRCLTCSLAELALSHSSFWAFSASLRTTDLFLISGGIAKPILQSTGFSDISLGAKRASDSLGALTMSEELLTGFEGHKSGFNFLNPANLNLFLWLWTSVWSMATE